MSERTTAHEPGKRKGEPRSDVKFRARGLTSV